MYVLEIALFVVGAILLLVGYRKTNRNLLLAAAVLLFLTGAIGDLTSGFSEGLSDRRPALHDAATST